MKQKDIVLLLVVGFVSLVLSLVLAQTVFSKKSTEYTAQKAEKITSEFKTPKDDDKVFNAQAINPTQIIQISDQANNNPF